MGFCENFKNVAIQILLAKYHRFLCVNFYYIIELVVDYRLKNGIVIFEIIMIKLIFEI